MAGCDDSLESSLPSVEVEIVLEKPEGIDDADISDATVSFRNISNATTTTEKYEMGKRYKLLPGLYTVTFEADCNLAGGALSKLKATSNNVELTANRSVTLKTFNSIESYDLVIAEIFFAGTLQNSGNQYYGDDYVKLYNNTDHVVYADGLTLFESKFITTDKYDYDPDIMSEAMTIHALYTIPGSGRDHPVKPGEYLLLADTGIDHRTVNPNSFDLSHADFEWYDVSTKPAHMDIDSPSVPNLDKWYCYTLSFFVLHNRGFKAYGIARIPIDKEEYLKDYRYTYNYTIVVEAGTFPMSQTAYRLPNEWIVDVVNCSVEAKYQWDVCAPSLDIGWTYCGTIDHDKTRYFHSVRRKVASFAEDGRPVLQDTNNSSADFNPMCIPSEIERQGTATDINGTPCTTRTYDGVMPFKTGN